MTARSISAWLIGSVDATFAIKEGTAFASGDGVLKPRGFLTYTLDSADDFQRAKWDSVQYFPTGATSPTDLQLSNAIIAISMKLRVPYRASARWMMNRATATKVRQLRDQNDMLLWSTDGRLIDGVSDRLLGFPIEYNEDMPSEGDFCAYKLLRYSSN